MDEQDDYLKVASISGLIGAVIVVLMIYFWDRVLTWF